MSETKILNVRFQQKIDTAENWANSAIILMAGEMAIESDTNKFKFGDGEHVYSELAYAGIDQAQLDAIEDNYHHVIPNADETDVQALNRVVATPKKGDIGVVERMIGEISTANTMTAYMYDGSAWKALSGNYDASNVYFDSDLTYTTSIGALKLASGKNSDVYAAKGKSLEEVIKRLMAETIAPSISAATYSMTASYTADNGTEVGSKVTALKWDGTFTDGSYSYGRMGADGTTSTTKSAGCTATYSMECDKAGSTTTPTTVDGTWTLTTPIQLTSTSETTIGTINTSCSISASPYDPINNIGEKVDGKLSAKTVDKSATVKITPYRAWFCGWKNGTNALADPTAITSEQVRALTKKNGSWESSMTVDKMKQMFFLAPAGANTKTIKVADSKTGAPQTILGPVTVYVTGANGYCAEGDETTNGGMAYDMWYVNNASAASGGATLNITLS